MSSATDSIAAVRPSQPLRAAPAVAESGRRRRGRGIAIILVQLLVTGAGLWFVFRAPEQRAQILEALGHADRRWLLAGWLCYGAVECLATVRWQMLLRLQGIALGWWRAAGLVIIGLFFNLFLPGLIGGDAMRLYFVFRQAPDRKPQAILSVAMDRLFGLLSLLFLAGLTLALRYDWLRQSGETLRIVHLTVGLLGLALAGAAALFLLAGFNLLPRLPARFPFRKGIIESGEALRQYRAHSLVMLAALGITLLSHEAYYLCYYCAGRSLQSTARPGDILSIMPLVNTVTAVPISLGGVGVRETLFQELLGHLARVPAVIAALTASLGYGLQATWGLVGAAAWLWSRRAARSADTLAPVQPGAGEAQEAVPRERRGEDRRTPG